ncbi:hypothetical protein [uncultured Roseobacter sp.]|uniref:alpha/beta hydrolase family protein n=1 Tax=uncultured Roseobacter sp. TaxID=114847 RepID=UPI0026222EC4|nr:hypothetical protein [uncultured Roseobacter sp.]
MAACGYRTGKIHDPARSNWQNSGDRPIAWSAWYPIEGHKDAERAEGHFFDLGHVIRNADLAGKARLPVVLLSHGTGGTAESLGWLARFLACKGHVVIGANHHGNTGLEPYDAAGFLCWWERAADLSLLLTSLSTTGFFANRFDDNHVSAIGFSLGAHTVLALGGARTSLTTFDAWRRANTIVDSGPAEFPDVADQIPVLEKTSEAFRRSWARHGEDFSDSRIGTLAAIAPAPPIRSFTPQTIAALKLPVTVLTGGADLEAPSAQCADWLMRQNKSFQRYDLGQNVGHYTFLSPPSDKSLVGKIDVFSDHKDVDRKQVHRAAADIVLAAIG